MHIILLVLKIIGIALLVLLSVILLLLLIVLFVPVRYRINAEKQEDIKAKAVVDWLFPFLFAKVEYQEQSLTYQIRIFGILIYPRKTRVKEKRQRKRAREGKKQKEPDLITMEVRTAEPEAPKQRAEAAEQKLEIEEKRLQAVEQEPKAVNQSTEAVEQKPKPESKKLSEEQPRSGWFTRWKQKLLFLLEKIADLREKWRLIADFLGQEENKKGLLQIWNSVKHIIRHIIPKRISGEIEFGLDDPCSTGQVLGIAGALYGFYGQSVRVIPNFEEACLNGEIFIKGRLRIFTFVRICIKLLLDNNFKRLRINFEKMKEAL